MNEPDIDYIKNEAVQAYLVLGDALRVAILPDWVVADLTASQLKALMLLSYYGALTVSALARLLNMGNSAASILVQQLVDQAFVERSEDPQDRRRTLVTLTARGAELISGRHQQTAARLHELLDQLSKEQLMRVLDGLANLANLVRAKRIPEEH